MATGDILSAVVRADGWSMDVTIEGFAVGATYDFGSLDDTPATVAAPKFSVAVVSEGYNAAGVLGTINRTVYGTHVVRKPYPNQASKDETVSGSDIVVRVALSESIYNDDKNGGAGTSGTDPAVTIAAGWATNTGGGAQTSAAATALVCTNNSTLDYPKCIAQWAWGHTPAWKRVAAAFDIGCIAYHGHGIACVALSATEGVNVVSGIATSKTAHLMSASALYYESYDLAVPVTTLTQGNDITLKFVAYPLVGDADSIIDTSTNTTSTDDIRGLTQITCTCDKTGALIDYAVVSTTGNDTTGAKSTTLATAAASPYLTVGKALASGATVIYLRAGTFDILGSTPASVTARNFYIEVRPYPAESVTLNRSGTWIQYKASRLAYIGIQTIAYSSGNGWLDGQAFDQRLLFQDCGFNTTATPGAAGLGYRSYGCWFVNCTGMGKDHYISGAVRVAYSFTGCINSSGIIIGATYSIVSCNFVATATDNNRFSSKSATGLAPQQDNSIYAHSEWLSCAVNANKVFEFGTGLPVSGLAFIGNIIEVKAETSSQAALWMFADSDVQISTNIVLAHNTIVGQRCNLFYNDTGLVGTERTNIFCRNNAFRSYEIKSDTFGTPNANRIGNWAPLNGVNHSDNRYDGSIGFTGDYLGINVAYETAANTTYGQLGYTDDNSQNGDGTGNGDYMPTEASVLYDHMLRQAYQSYDLYGVAL